jgi:hypothetical protein
VPWPIIRQVGAGHCPDLDAFDPGAVQTVGQRGHRARRGDHIVDQCQMAGQRPRAHAEGGAQIAAPELAGQTDLRGRGAFPDHQVVAHRDAQRATQGQGQLQGLIEAPRGQPAPMQRHRNQGFRQRRRTFPHPRREQGCQDPGLGQIAAVFEAMDHVIHGVGVAAADDAGDKGRRMLQAAAAGAGHGQRQGTAMAGAGESGQGGVTGRAEVEGAAAGPPAEQAQAGKECEAARAQPGHSRSHVIPVMVNLISISG